MISGTVVTLELSVEVINITWKDATYPVVEFPSFTVPGIVFFPSSDGRSRILS
jgi:hypothetical protein